MTTTTLTLAAFLSARLDEDEAVARAAKGPRWTAGEVDWPSIGRKPAVLGPKCGCEDSGLEHDDCTRYVIATTWQGDTMTADAAHIARHDPARVLADVEAKRRIVATHRPDQHPDWQDGICLGCQNDDPCPTLRLLALPYASLELYRDEWRP